jgi:hypothetical protein
MSRNENTTLSGCVSFSATQREVARSMDDVDQHRVRPGGVEGLWVKCDANHQKT